MKDVLTHHGVDVLAAFIEQDQLVEYARLQYQYIKTYGHPSLEIAINLAKALGKEPRIPPYDFRRINNTANLRKL